VWGSRARRRARKVGRLPDLERARGEVELGERAIREEEGRDEEKAREGSAPAQLSLRFVGTCSESG